MMSRLAEETRTIRVYATPYAYTQNGAPLYIEYGGVHASRAAHAVHSLAAASISPSVPLSLPASPSALTKRAHSDLSAPTFNPSPSYTAWPAAHSAGSRPCNATTVGSSSSDGSRAAKKSRLVWTDALHAKFVNAVQALGVDTAVPKQIMARMGVHSLTRENVASHLQKYRASVKRARREQAVAHLNAPLFRDETGRRPDSLELFSAVAAGRPRALPPPTMTFAQRTAAVREAGRTGEGLRQGKEGTVECVRSPHAVMAPIAFTSPRAGDPPRVKEEVQRLPSMKLAPLAQING